MRTFNTKVAAAIAVSIDVESGVLLKFIAMVLSPLRGAKQHGLFAVPGAINDRAFRLPSLFEQFAERSGFFQQSDLAGDGIFSAIHPAIVMITADNPLVRRFRAGNFKDRKSV